MPEPADQTAGVDEAGRGPLAGPVVAAAVILDPDRPIVGLADSKVLSAKQRETLAEEIRKHALAVGLCCIEAEEIDRINILQATLKAMAGAVQTLAIAPARVLVDGNRLPELPMPAIALVGGDALEPAISAASIIAKTHRDAIMHGWHQRYPAYGFDRHKGYGTAAHLQALATHGPCPAHRQSFRPLVQTRLF